MGLVNIHSFEEILIKTIMRKSRFLIEIETSRMKQLLNTPCFKGTILFVG